MRNSTSIGVFLLIFGCFIVIGFSSCQPSVQGNNNAVLAEDTLSKENPPLVTWEIFDTTYYSGNCEKSQDHCLSIKLHYPVFSGDEAIAAYLNRELEAALILLLLDSDKGLKANSLEVAVNELMQYYVNIHQRYRDEPGWTFELTSHAELLAGSFLSLRTNADVFTGGAHPNSFTQLSSYELTRPDRLSLKEVVTDTLALEQIAEEIFRQDKELDKTVNLDAEGFLFIDGKFSLNRNFQLTPKGLLFFFNSYEIAAYAYGPTELLIPYEKIKSILQPDILNSFLPDRDNALTAH